MSRVCKEQVYVWRRVDQKVKWLARFWKVSKMQLVGTVTFLARFGTYQSDDWWKLSRCWLCFNIVQRDNWWFCVACREFLVMGDGGWRMVQNWFTVFSNKPAALAQCGGGRSPRRVGRRKHCALGAVRARPFRRGELAGRVGRCCVAELGSG